MKPSNSLILELAVWSIVENGCKIILSSYRIFWAFEKGVSHFCKVQIVTKWRNSNRIQTKRDEAFKTIAHRKHFKKWLEANFRSYSISRAFQNRIFHVFANFSATMWGKWRKWDKKSKLFKFDGFEATLRSKANVVNIWECHFLIFCKFLSNKVETVFW